MAPRGPFLWELYGEWITARPKPTAWHALLVHCSLGAREMTHTPEERRAAD